MLYCVQLHSIKVYFVLVNSCLQVLLMCKAVSVFVSLVTQQPKYIMILAKFSNTVTQIVVFCTEIFCSRCITDNREQVLNAKKN